MNDNELTALGYLLQEAILEYSQTDDWPIVGDDLPAAEWLSGYLSTRWKSDLVAHGLDASCTDEVLAALDGAPNPRRVETIETEWGNADSPGGMGVMRTSDCYGETAEERARRIGTYGLPAMTRTVTTTKWRPADTPEAPEVEAPRWSEAMMLDLLREKYTRVRTGTNADRYVRASHVRYPSGWGDALRIADYIVLDTYTPNEIIGFEVKVSRSDWLAELRDPRKADVWRKHCHRWYLVVPDLRIVRDDLPEGWGLIGRGSGGLRVSRRAPVVENPEPMPLDVLCQLGRAIAQTATREVLRGDH